MGTVIPKALFSENVSKSVVSEGVLCSLFDFKVVKEKQSCFIINKRLNKTAEVSLLPGHLQYVLPPTLFLDDVESSIINLASVRPSNPKTLWHGRFGHAYMGLIIKMARNPIYQARGLKLPDDLLRTDHDEDLCENCALGKPTFSFAYVPQFRSEIKGKLWYFDVSGGGNLEPSLVSKETYLYLFVDSHTRMYFAYYTKNVDEETTMRILKQFNTEVLVALLEEELEVTFIQSDNGQLNTNGVKSWLRKRKIFNRFISPYHPNMNGFAERAFRSIKDLGRCMLDAAGLPDPYWKKATAYAVLLRNIMPNQTIDGYVREAYFKWYGLTYDYSRLRTWGCRAYVMNHVRDSDYGARSVEGIFVGMNPRNPVTYEYDIYIPAKNLFVTSGDVIFCEHVGRKEPERLLPPILSLKGSCERLNVKDYQELIDTVHMDNEEGVTYKVIKVYSSKGLAVVDRVLYDPNRSNEKGGVIDTVHLKDVLGYPILLGKQNPGYRPTLPTNSADEVINHSESDRFDRAVRPERTEALKGKAKRLRSDAHQASVEANTAGLVQRRRLRSNVSTNVADVQGSNPAVKDDIISKTILDWAFEHIPDELWEPVASPDSNVNYTGSSDTSTAPAYDSEPRHHGEAMSRASERELWKASEKREIDALEELNFAEIVDIPEDRTPLPIIWVYKYKTDETGKVVLHKSRLVVRGDLAIQGFDYFETYSPVAKIDSIRLVLAIIIVHRMLPVQMDISNAYVQSEISEEVYVKAIPGVPLPLGKCLKLLRSLYGMPQAGRNWNSVISIFLIELNFVCLREDLCVYGLFELGILVAVIALYVDDIIAGLDSEIRKKWFVDQIMARFKAKYLGLPTNVVGLAVTWMPIQNQIYFQSVKIVNIKSIKVLGKKFELMGSKPVKLPYNEATKLTKIQCPVGAQLECPDIKQMQTEYRTLVGTFIWLQTTTRVDITQTVLVLSQFVSNPSYQHYKAALWLVKYLLGTLELGIVYDMNADAQIVGYVDADHASHESRRSIYSYIFMFAGAPLFWKNGFETRFSLSTAESEIRAVFALREAIKHVLYLKKVFKSLLLEDIADKASIAMSNLPTAIFEDNLAALRYSLNPSSQSTMKYLEVDILWIHDAIKRKEFVLLKIDTKQQLADIGTKFMTSEVFEYLRGMLLKY